MTGGAGAAVASGATCLATAGSSAIVVIGRAVVFRTGVKPVRGLFRLLGVVPVALRAAAGTPSDVYPCAGTGSSASSGAARFLPATIDVGTMGSCGLEVDALAGSGVFAWKVDEDRRFSGVLRPSRVEGPDFARECDGEVDGAAEVEGNDLVYCAGATTAGC
jgi:hypothetical protein